MAVPAVGAVPATPAIVGLSVISVILHLHQPLRGHHVRGTLTSQLWGMGADAITGMGGGPGLPAVPRDGLDGTGTGGDTMPADRGRWSAGFSAKTPNPARNNDDAAHARRTAPIGD